MYRHQPLVLPIEKVFLLMVHIYMTEMKRFDEQRPDESDRVTAGWTRFAHKTSWQNGNVIFFFPKKV